MTTMRRTLYALLAAVALLPGVAGAQETAGPMRLGLDEALARALGRSEEVLLARARVDAADASYRTARSAALPQLNTQLTYTRALRSVFQSAGTGFSLPDSLKFDPDPSAPLADRVAYLEDRVPSAALGALGSAFSGLPFGNENTWIAGLTFAQPVFAGGRIRSSIDMADYGRDAAEASFDDAAAEVALQVKQAYFDAAMAQSSVDIVEASVTLASDHLDRVKLQLDAGRASELEALRAEVELENLRPQLVQAENQRELAMMNLKRLVNLPAEAELVFTTPLMPGDSMNAPALAVDLPSLDRADAALGARASLRSAEATVSMREEQVDVAKAAFLPSLSLTANLTRQAFPTGTFGVPSGGDWRDDWNVGFAVQWPLFQGLRRNADLDAARAQVRQAELQRDQLREGVRLEYEQAKGELQRARAQIGASHRTVDQAARVYDLTEMRFTEGLATQLDVSDARLSLQQARLNEVRAWHDAQVALARVERALGAGPNARGIR